MTNRRQHLGNGQPADLDAIRAEAADARARRPALATWNPEQQAAARAAADAR